MIDIKEKKAPELPKEVAEKYDCLIMPCVVNISKPMEIAGRYDLTEITLANAEKLAKAGKYFKPKEAAKAEKK